MARRSGVGALAAAFALCAVAAPALAQQDVGPVRVALFAGARLGHETRPLFGLAGELELHGALHGTWILAAAASTVSQREGSYAQYEVDARWRPEGEGRLLPYVGGGAVLTRRSSLMAGGPTQTGYGGLAIAGVEIPLLGTTAFVEGLALEDGAFSAQLRGGVRLLLIGR